MYKSACKGFLLPSCIKMFNVRINVRILYERRIHFWENDEQITFDIALLQIKYMLAIYMCCIYYIYILIYEYLPQFLYIIITIINKL